MKTLAVHHHGLRIGTLSQTTLGAIAFQYDAEWLSKPNAHPISQSLPLRKEVFEERECVGFFGGLLPEDYNREKSSSSIVGELEKYPKDASLCLLRNRTGETWNAELGQDKVEIPSGRAIPLHPGIKIQVGKHMLSVHQ